MKRSEMVKLIADAIYDHKVLAVIHPDDVADLILTKQENAGMLPPSYKFEMGGKMMRDNGWEQEDD